MWTRSKAHLKVQRAIERVGVLKGWDAKQTAWAIGGTSTYNAQWPRLEGVRL